MEVDTWGSFGGACRLDHGPSAVIRRAINTKSDWCGQVSRRQGDLDAGFEFLDAHGDLEEAAAQGFEACPPPG